MVHVPENKTGKGRSEQEPSGEPSKTLVSLWKLARGHQWKEPLSKSTAMYKLEAYLKERGYEVHIDLNSFEFVMTKRESVTHVSMSG